MTFELPLTEQKVKPHQVTALHLMVGLACAGAGAVLKLAYEPAKHWGMALLVAGLALVAITMFRNKWVLKNNVNRILRVGELVVLSALAIFFLIQNWPPPAIVFGVLSAAVLFSIFWERDGANSLLIRIDNEGVKLPVTARRRQIDWRDIEHVLLRFGTLTINCHDNRLYQWTIGTTNVDSKDFEQFCSQQIEEGKTKRDKNDW